MQWIGSSLVYANIVHLESGGEICPGRITSARAADGEVQGDVGRLMKGIPSLRVLVKRMFEIGPVQQDVVNIEPDGCMIPSHPPAMKLHGPIGVVVFTDGLLHGVPRRRPALLRSPGHIGQEYAPIILHNVYLAVAWPFAFDPQGPECGPEPLTRVNPSPHFETAILPIA